MPAELKLYMEEQLFTLSLSPSWTATSQLLPTDVPQTRLHINGAVSKFEDRLRRGGWSNDLTGRERAYTRAVMREVLALSRPVVTGRPKMVDHTRPPDQDSYDQIKLQTRGVDKSKGKDMGLALLCNTVVHDPWHGSRPLAPLLLEAGDTRPVAAMLLRAASIENHSPLQSMDLPVMLQIAKTIGRAAALDYALGSPYLQKWVSRLGGDLQCHCVMDYNRIHLDHYECVGLVQDVLRGYHGEMEFKVACGPTLSLETPTGGPGVAMHPLEPTLLGIELDCYPFTRACREEWAKIRRAPNPQMLVERGYSIERYAPLVSLSSVRYRVKL